MAGVSGLEPEPKVLETSMLTIDTIPLRLFWILDFGFWIEGENIFRFNPKSCNPKSKIDSIYFPDAVCGNGNDGKTF
jgi:hypothetical protein